MLECWGLEEELGKIRQKNNTNILWIHLFRNKNKINQSVWGKKLLFEPGRIWRGCPKGRITSKSEQENGYKIAKRVKCTRNDNERDTANR